MKISSIDTSTFMILFLIMVFSFAVGVPTLLDYPSSFVKYPVKVTIVKNCCDTGYCIKTLDEKVIQRISTTNGMKLDTINYSFDVEIEFNVFGKLVEKRIIWKIKQ